MSEELKISELPLNTKGTWKGKVKAVLYVGQNNYSVVSVAFEDGTVMTCEGNIPYAIEGSDITVTGKFVHNEKYNSNQIKVSEASVKTNPDAQSAILFLSNVVYGLGEKKAKKIVEMYGNNPDDYLTDINKMKKVSGITLKGFEKIKASYLENKHLFPLYKAVHGDITTYQAKLIYDKYKENAEGILHRNPYQLTYDLSGVGFLKADKLALKAGIKSDSDDRILAAIIYSLKNNESKSGSSCISMTALYENLTEILFGKEQFMYIYYQDVLKQDNIPDEKNEWDALILPEIIKSHKTKLNNALEKWDSDTARNKFIKEMKISQDEIDTLDYFYEKKLDLRNKLERIVAENSYDAGSKSIKDIIPEIRSDRNNTKQLITETVGNSTVVYIAGTYKAELNAAEVMINMTKKPSIFSLSPEYINNVISEVEKEELKKLQVEDAKKPVIQRTCPNKYSFGEDQKDAVRMALNNRISCITGGPGRGKTTIIRAIIKAWKKHNSEAQVILLAPTGKAAKRMTESTGCDAYTIHRFLLNKSILLNSKTIVFADETSMVDIFLLKTLLYKIKDCQLVLVGDKDQLPSVGVGKCLEDIIESGTIPVTFLTTCYRNKGSILENVESINNGCRLQELRNDAHFKTIWINERPDIINSVINTYMNNYVKYGAENMMVLAAMTDTVSKLNSLIQQKVNPKTPNKIDIPLNGGAIRKGDRVMQTSNDYQMKTEIMIDGEIQEVYGIFNGDTGTVTAINETSDPDTGISGYMIEVTFDDGKIAKYDNKTQWNKLTLAYAITYHKSQGSEAKCVIGTLSTGDFILLQKKILYTGISRAKDLCYMIGSAKAFQMAIYNFSGKNGIRLTRLKEKLQELKEADN